MRELIEREKIKELSYFLVTNASKKANYHPVDRFFLNDYLEEILAFDSTDFILFNLENQANLYSVQLLLCLPELWENLGYKEIMKLINSFTNVFSFYAFIKFTHKYLEIDIFDMIYNNDQVPLKFKKDISGYMINITATLVKDEDDYFFFEKGLIGVSLEDWNYVKQKLLLDERIKPAIKSLPELYARLKYYNERYNKEGASE